MADNVAVTPGTGATVAADDIGGGVLAQRVKPVFGPDGTGTDVSLTSGLPIQGTQAAASTTSWTSATSINTANSISVTGLNTVSVVAITTSTFTGGVLTFEVSPDGTNWAAVAMARIDSYTVESVYTLVATTTRAWSTSVDGFTNFRVRLSTAITGTGTLTVIAVPQTMPIEPISTVGQSVASNLQGQMNILPTTTGGLSIYHLVSAATTNATNVKASAGQLYGWYIYNSNAAARKVSFYNTAGTPTVGTSVIFSIVVPPTSGANVFSETGISFATGIGIGTSTGLADSDATAVALNDLVINLFYKQAAMAIAVVQRKTAADAGGAASKITLAFTSSVTAGNTIIIGLAMSDSTQVLFQQELHSPTDTLNNVYYFLYETGFNATSGVGVRWYAAYNIAGGANTITVNDTANDTEAVAYEVSGLATYAAYDKAASANIAATTSYSSGASAATAFINELVLGGFGIATTGVVTVGAGYATAQQASGTSQSFTTEEKIISATGAQTATATGTSTSGIASVITFADTASVSRVASVSVLGRLFDTNSGTHTVTATPAVGDLIVIIQANTGNTTNTAPTDNNSGGAGTYTLINSALKATSVDNMNVYVRTALVTSATSTIFSAAAGTTTGGGLTVYKVTGMTKTGATAVKQSAVQANQATATVPAPALGSALVSPNPVITAVFNATGTATSTQLHNPLMTAMDAISSWATPTAGFLSAYNSGGSPSNTITWGSQSPSAFCSLAIELDSSGTASTVRQLSALGVG